MVELIATVTATITIVPNCGHIPKYYPNTGQKVKVRAATV